MDNGAKVSFSVRSKSSSKPRPSQNQNDDGDDQPNKQYVTEFDPDKTPTDSKKPRRIIPRKAPPPPPSAQPPTNRRMENLELAIAQSRQESEQLQWELENKSSADADAGQISYGLNLRTTNNGNGGGRNNQDAAAGPAIEPFEKMVSKDFKKELEKLPEDEGLDQFEDMPVEEFGAALLGGLGWYEGRGIGKNSKGNVKIREFGKKSFVSDDVVVVKKEKKKDELKRSGDRDNKHNQESRNGEKSEKPQVNKRSRESERREDKYNYNNKDKVGVPWVRSHIRVRIISKELKRGRLYLKKGEVVDVVGPTMCDISMDESGELIQGVNQDLLETALPRRGGPVLVLYGRHKGVYGDLVDRDLDRETGVVRDADTHELLNVKLEQIAEYIGDPSYLGY